ncbi:MAG: HAD family phosphatase [Actinomycetia bacterium]|nr:HAD family phosphatase [Actinomycetes bacterium]
MTRAVVFDFGGVLTTSVFAAFRELGRSIGDERLPLRLLAHDKASSRLLVEHEEGRIGEAEFEAGYAERLRAHGATVVAGGLMRSVRAAMRRDDAMVDLVATIRMRGYPVGLLSNSMGENSYAGWDLPAMFDAVTISGDIGVRKPSRRAYQIACSRLGVEPREAVMVDDLRQNIDAAERLGMAGVLHRDATFTAHQLDALLGRRRPSQDSL